MTDLDVTADALKDARRHLNACLVLASAYVAERAADDPEAAELTGLIRSAFDRMNAEGIAAATLIADRTKDGIN